MTRLENQSSRASNETSAVDDRRKCIVVTAPELWERKPLFVSLRIFVPLVVLAAGALIQTVYFPTGVAGWLTLTLTILIPQLIAALLLLLWRKFIVAPFEPADYHGTIPETAISNYFHENSSDRHNGRIQKQISKAIGQSNVTAVIIADQHMTIKEIHVSCVEFELMDLENESSRIDSLLESNVLHEDLHRSPLGSRKPLTKKVVAWSATYLTLFLLTLPVFTFGVNFRIPFFLFGFVVSASIAAYLHYRIFKQGKVFIAQGAVAFKSPPWRRARVCRPIPSNPLIADLRLGRLHIPRGSDWYHVAEVSSASCVFAAWAWINGGISPTDEAIVSYIEGEK